MYKIRVKCYNVTDNSKYFVHLEVYIGQEKGVMEFFILTFSCT